MTKSFSDDGTDWEKFVDEALSWDDDEFFKYHRPDGARLDKVFLELKHVGGKLLDVGCNIARWKPVVEKAGYEYFGVEPCQKAIDIARKQGANVKWGIGQALPFEDKSFDAVMLMTVLQHQNVETRKTILSEVERVLKDEGILIIHDVYMVDETARDWGNLFEKFNLLEFKYPIHKFNKRRNPSSDVKSISESEPEHDYERYYILREGDVFVEGGSFFGRWALRASKQVGGKGRVIAIEASPENFSNLKLVTKGIQNIILVEKALWNKKGESDFWINTSISMLHWTGHRIPGRKHGEPKQLSEYNIGLGYRLVTVETDKLDNILKDLGVEKVNLLAWDIEGAEVEALEGCEEYLKEGKILNLALCFYHMQIDVQRRAEKKLEAYGYKILKNVGGIIYAKR